MPCTTVGSPLTCGFYRRRRERHSCPIAPGTVAEPELLRRGGVARRAQGGIPPPPTAPPRCQQVALRSARDQDLLGPDSPARRRVDGYRPGPGRGRPRRQGARGSRHDRPEAGSRAALADGLPSPCGRIPARRRCGSSRSGRVVEQGCRTVPCVCLPGRLITWTGILREPPPPTGPGHRPMGRRAACGVATVDGRDVGSDQGAP